MLIAAAIESPVAPTASALVRAWSWNPGVVVGLSVTALIYVAAVRHARAAGGSRALPTTAVACFVAGWLSLVAALVSPLDALGETLFAAHMVQHLVLIMVAAPLLVLGSPTSIVWSLPATARRSVARWWNQSVAPRGIVRFATRPGIVLAAHVLALWIWHFPRPYQAALEHPWLHALEHLSFLGTALLFWWVVLRPTGRRTLGFGASIIYLGSMLCSSGALGALLMFSRDPWYSAHAAGESLWGMTAIGDQQLAGLLMWIPAGVVYLAAAAWNFTRWMRMDERAGAIADGRAGALAGEVT